MASFKKEKKSPHKLEVIGVQHLTPNSAIVTKRDEDGKVLKSIVPTKPLFGEDWPEVYNSRLEKKADQ